MSTIRRSLAPLALALCATSVHAQSAASTELTLGAPFGDHMVLQRETGAPLWGTAAPDAAVVVATSWDGGLTVTHADGSGRWRMTVRTPEAGGPYTITVSDDGQERALRDVLIGEVWVCSGQSNMEWPMTAIDDSEAEIATADQPGIRLFDVARNTALEPLETATGTWRVCTPETVRGFSAVGFLFGRELHETLDVPIGLIGTNWGGTPAEAWTSEQTLRAGFPEFAPALDRIARVRAGEESTASLAEEQARWWRRLEENEPGTRGGWMEASFTPEAWEVAQLPGTWRELGLGGFDGCVWYRREVELPAEVAGRELVLELGPIDDMDLTWVNGALVGETRTGGRHATPRRYTVPAGVATAGTNTIVVCAVDTGGVGRVGAAAEDMRLGIPGGTSVPLAGGWRYRAGASLADLGSWPRSSWFGPGSPTSLFNGMLAPLIPTAIRGAIWYQGEANVARAQQYRRLFPAMIADWRRHWQRGDFPFYFVQIAPFRYGNDAGQAAELREAQLFTARDVPNTGVAVTMDVGDPADIHPRDKQTVAHRLALLARKHTYGEAELVAHGPTYAGTHVEEGALRLRFTHSEGLHSGDQPLHGFTIAGADRAFHPAEARIEDGTVVVRSELVPEPVAVRFAWGAADESGLWNGAGLPASSFRTDDWPAVSAER